MSELKIINETIAYDQLYDRLLHAYPDKILHYLIIDQSTIVKVPQSVQVFTYDTPLTNVLGIQIARVDKFLDFIIGDNVAITNNQFISELSWWRSTMQTLLKSVKGKSR